ncbi:hypothetical protein J3B02_000123 [Coemansia erecta]|nr:hypothetical protein J3B02_000123 [Coemansia erecta]KAJ2889205.1 hypothetical protein FB639_000074 [Coemansia asiatica]
MSTSPETTAAAPNAAQVPKVFVGNLPYKTTDEQLKAFFSDIEEPVEVRVIKRGIRSMGYGFVSFGSLAAVNKAVAAKDQAELDGRVLKVEIAKPASKEAEEEGSARPVRRRQFRRKAEKKETKEVGAAEEPAKQQSGVESSGEEAGKPAAKSGAGRRNNGRRHRQRRFPKKDGNPDSVATDSPNAESKPAAAGKDSSKASARAAARAAARANAKPSDTVIYVGNLPYSTTDEELSKLFSDFSISSAHVVVAKRTNRHKGYGFVTLANPVEQLKVIDRFSNNPIVVNERILNISPALSEYPASTDQASEGEATA